MENTETAGKVNGEVGNGHVSEAEAENLAVAEDELRAWAATYTPDLDAATLLGDWRDAIWDIIREQREPVHKLSEKQQTYFVRRIEDATRVLVERGIELVAARGFPVIFVNLEQVAFKPKVIEAKLSFNAIDRAVRHQLVDAQGSRVAIVVSDPAAFMRARGPAKIDKDAPELPIEPPVEEARGPLPDQGEGGDLGDGQFDEADTADLKRPGNRADKGKRAPVVADPHPDAREIGKADGLAGNQDRAARFPPGQYGHADYELGRAVGQNERAALLATARELGAVAGKAGEDAATNPFDFTGQRDQHAEWRAGWIAPEPGNNGGHVEPPAPPKRRPGRPRRDPGARDRSL